MISFNNTEIAFRHKSNRDINRAHLLFSIVGSPVLVKIGKKVTNFCLRIGIPIKKAIKATIFKQFCGGETIEECSATIHELWNSKVGTILDYSIEGKTEEIDFEKTTIEIIDTILAGKNNEAIPFAVFKITGIARFSILELANSEVNNLSSQEFDEYNAVLERINRICKAAFDNDVSVFIDAEESWIQGTIDRICHEMMKKYNLERAIVFNTVQMYRHDRLTFLKESIAWGKNHKIHYGVKLVRGAYMEKERKRAETNNYLSPIQPNKEACDTDYNLALDFLLDELESIALCAGTHNESSSMKLVEMIENRGISPNDKRIYFAQLLGMSDHISYNLAFHGFNVAKYVPYGPVQEVVPYLLRRADENTSVKGQTGRELSLLREEKKRRKQ